MNKTVLGAIIGGAILFVWSFMAWTVLPLHSPTLHRIGGEDEVVAMLRSHLEKKGVYMFPGSPGAETGAEEAWAEKVKRGPNGYIVYDPAGADPFMPMQMLYGLILDILSAWVVCWFLARSVALNASYVGRVAFCAMFGLFAALFSSLLAWNWMGVATDYTSAMIIDAIVGWILAGLGIASMVKAPALTTT